jgi:hypothetical protein
LILRPMPGFRFWMLFAFFWTFVVSAKLIPILAMAINGPLSYRADRADIRPEVNRNLGNIPLFIAIGGRAIKQAFLFLKPFPLIAALIFIGLVLSRLREKIVLRYFALLFACPLFFATAYTLKPYFFDVLPLLKGYNMRRIVLFIPFVASIGAGFGVHFLFERSKKMGWAAGILVAGALLIENKMGSFGFPSYHYLFSIPEVSLLKEIEKSKNLDVPYRVGELTIGNEFPSVSSTVYGFDTIDGYIVIYPRRFKKFWSKVIEPIKEKNADGERRFQAFVLAGGGAVMPMTKDLLKDTDITIELGKNFRLNLLSLANTKYFFSHWKLDGDGLKLIHEREKSSSTWVSRHFKTGSLYIYENLNVLPRIFVAGSALSFPTEEEVLDAMTKTNAADLQKTVYLEEKFLRGNTNLQINFHNINSTTYHPDRLRIELSLKGTGILVVTNSFHPFWTAKVNGVATEILPVYQTFMGILLSSQGEDVTVELEYQPPYKL